MSRKASEIWSHFDKKDNSVYLAVCKYCQLTLSYKSTTGNLSSHLKRSHTSIYLAQRTTTSGTVNEPTHQTTTIEQNLVLPSTSAIGNASEPTISSTAAKSAASTDQVNLRLIELPQVSRKRQKTMQNYIIKKMTPDEKKRVDRDLLELFITDYQPFRLVEDEGFKNFIKHIPGYTLSFVALYQQTLSSVREIVSRDAKSVCLTTDLWTSSQTESYIGVTAH
ncbi:unnamed protein product [Parnassius mnemosyne]|uniref:BED-type domain-containing protein n=1 Tax=Parnassius mnemosyne TaxID=213953 RepID=A0AAV1KQ88_9NEOP